jgi:hypothetical protein
MTQEVSGLNSGMATLFVNETGIMEHTQDAHDFRRSSIGAANADIDPRYEGKPYMIILWLFISFVIGAFTRHLLEVRAWNTVFFMAQKNTKEHISLNFLISFPLAENQLENRRSYSDLCRATGGRRVTRLLGIRYSREWRVFALSHVRHPSDPLMHCKLQVTTRTLVLREVIPSVFVSCKARFFYIGTQFFTDRDMCLYAQALGKLHGHQAKKNAQNL